MSYELAMTKAGAEVIDYKETGSYQGDWYALVRFNGQLGIAEGSYGSCSGCDAFLSEFDFDDNKPDEQDGKYYRGAYYHEKEISKGEYDELCREYDKRLADFGSDYLKNISDKQLIETRLAELRKNHDEDNGYSFYDDQIEGLEWCLQKLNIEQEPERSVANPMPKELNDDKQI